MVSDVWTADPEALAEAERSFTEAASAREEAGALRLLGAAGRLSIIGAGARVTAWRDARADRGRALAEALGREDAGAIEDAAVALRSLLDRRMFGAGEVTRDELARGVEAALAVRDEAEQRVIGAETILGRSPALDDAQESARMLFERLIRPEVWRLTEVNALRRARLASIAPRYRASFWWWREGAEIADHAVSALPAVAELAARFPAAAEALSSLVTARRAWDEAGSARRRAASVISLAAWLGRRASEARAALAGQVPGDPRAPLSLAAAAADEEITLVDEADLQISWAPPDALVIDLVAERAEGQAPSLRLDDGALLMARPVEGALERWAFRVDPSALTGQAILQVPLRKGTIEITLPPEER